MTKNLGSLQSWPNFIPGPIAAMIWPLCYDNHSIWAWHRYFNSYTMLQWAEASAQHAVNGQMWSVRSWYEWYRAHAMANTWSGLVWSLTFLNITPQMVDKMVKSMRRGPDGGSKM